ncbi:hypothetical protein [Lentzea pudingi]|uniref:hypothetical protein n=1 Tax=Lentzea pudingi TaxID=1789439 RepID=UPI00166B2EB5|nr:hypothetical protein [Lentzea pudingi]
MILVLLAVTAGCGDADSAAPAPTPASTSSQSSSIQPAEQSAQPVALESLCAAVDIKAASKRLTGVAEAVVAAAPLLPTPPRQAGCELTGSNAKPADVLRIVLMPAVRDGVDVFRDLSARPGVVPMNVNGQRMVWQPDDRTLHVRFLNTKPHLGGTLAGVDSVLSFACVASPLDAPSYTSCGGPDAGTTESRDVLAATQIVRGFMKAASPAQAGPQARLEDYVGEWGFHGTTVTVRSDSTGKVVSNLGPCRDINGPMCRESAELRFVLAADGLIGFYQSFSYSDLDGTPLPPGMEIPSYAGKDQDSFRIRKVGDGLYTLAFLRTAGRPTLETPDGTRYLCGMGSPPSAYEKCGS